LFESDRKDKCRKAINRARVRIRVRLNIRVRAMIAVSGFN